MAPSHWWIWTLPGHLIGHKCSLITNLPSDTSFSYRKLTTNYCYFGKVWQHQSIIFREKTWLFWKLSSPHINIYIFSPGSIMPKMKKVRTLWLRQIMLFAVVYLFLVSNYWLCCARRKRNNAEETPRKKLYVVLCEDLFYFIVCIEQSNSWLYQS